MLLKIAIGIGAVIGGLLIYVATLPADMFISRELLINAKAEVIFPYINNSRLTNDWMPWKDADPSVEMTYSGPAEGVGSTSSWDSKGQMGTGHAIVVESTPGQNVKTKLTYTRPMEMSQLAEMTLTPAGDGTVVRWSVSGQNSFIGRLFCLFMNMDKTVGGEFEKGLAKLKAIVESSSGR